jgi:CHAD domain-containing protein
VKRHRYATEFFAGTFAGEKAAKRQADSLSALKDLQDALGALNDLATHRALAAGGGDGEGAPPGHIHGHPGSAAGD